MTINDLCGPWNMKLIIVFIYMIMNLRKTLIIVSKLDTDIKNTFNNK